MTVVIENADQERLFIETRRRLGHDRHDEVWDGVYIVSPDPNNEHQRIAIRLSRCFLDSIEDAALGLVSAGGNVSDREIDWTQNYRCPDISVFLSATSARDLGSHWLGGPDFAVEVISKDDRSRDKFDFYASVGTRELLLVDRYPWALELYRSEEGDYRLVGKSTLLSRTVLVGAVLLLAFCPVEGSPRPTITATHADGVRTWSIRGSMSGVRAGGFP